MTHDHQSLFPAGYIAIKIPVMVDILGVENIASANGVNILMIGTAGVLGSPVASKVMSAQAVARWRHFSIVPDLQSFSL